MTSEEVRAAEVDLVKLIKGTVIRVGDPGYVATLNIDNGRISHRPYLVAMAPSARDVASTVRYCSEHDLRLTTKAGGHSAAGYCLNSDGIVLDRTIPPKQKTKLENGTGNPSITYVVEGEVWENRSDEASSIRRTGEYSVANNRISYYWENTTMEPIVLWVVDILRKGQ